MTGHRTEDDGTPDGGRMDRADDDLGRLDRAAELAAAAAHGNPVEARDVARQLLTGGIIAELIAEVRALRATITALEDTWTLELDRRVDRLRRERRRTVTAVLATAALAFTLAGSVAFDTYNTHRDSITDDLDDRTARLERLAEMLLDDPAQPISESDLTTTTTTEPNP